MDKQPDHTPAPDSAKSPTNGAPWASMSPRQMAAMAVLFESYEDTAPVSVNERGWPVDAEGRGVSMATEYEPTVPSMLESRRVDQCVPAHGQLGEAVYLAMDALESISVFGELLAFECAEDGCEEPRFVLSDRQRMALLRSGSMLADHAANRLAWHMERDCARTPAA